jgi:predicted acyltransferase
MDKGQMTGIGVHPNYQTLTILFIAAIAMLFTAYAWGLSFPINKKIWTSSYCGRHHRTCDFGVSYAYLFY